MQSRCFWNTSTETHTVTPQGRHEHWPASILVYLLPRAAHPHSTDCKSDSCPGQHHRLTPVLTRHHRRSRKVPGGCWYPAASSSSSETPVREYPELPRDMMQSGQLGSLPFGGEGRLYHSSGSQRKLGKPIPIPAPGAALPSADRVIAASHDRLLQKSTGKQRLSSSRSIRERSTQCDLVTIPGAPNF